MSEDGVIILTMVFSTAFGAWAAWYLMLISNIKDLDRSLAIMRRQEALIMKLIEENKKLASERDEADWWKGT